MAQNGVSSSMGHVRGLSNSTDENKCFFNAVVQCLARTPFFMSVLKEPSDEFHFAGGKLLMDDTNEEFPPISGKLDAKGPLTTALAETLDDLQKDGDVYDPIILFQNVTQVCPQFDGGDQHDCHELLRQLLEKIKTEDLCRFYNEHEMQTSSLHERKHYTQQAIECIFSGKMFRGLLVSTLTCQVCEYSSARYEEFLDLSLPMYVEKLEEVVTIKRNASKKNARSKAVRVTEKIADQPMLVDDTDSEVQQNGNGESNAQHEHIDHFESNATAADQKQNDHDGITCNNKNDNESSNEASVGNNYQFMENCENINLIPKKYKLKRIIFNTLEDCLINFTECELMTDTNKVRCTNCTEINNGITGESVNTTATKQFLISSPPAVLILHLKRFEIGDRENIRKISHHVKYPFHLDMTSFCESKLETMYSLYAIIQHKQRSKNMGHYVAYVKMRPNITADDPRWKFVPNFVEKMAHLRKNRSSSSESTGTFPTSTEAPADTTGSTAEQWYFVSDSAVKPVTAESVLKIQAYLLFYERIY